MKEEDQFLLLISLALAAFALFVIWVMVPSSPRKISASEDGASGEIYSTEKIPEDDPRLRSWGILATSVVMFFIALLGGTKGNPYAALWLYSIYLAYKGKLGTLKSCLKIVIAINLVLGLGLLLFADPKTFRYISPLLHSHVEFIIAISIPLMIKMGLVYWINRRIERANERFGDAQSNNFQPNQHRGIPTHNVSVSQGSTESRLPSITPITPKSEDWANALDEYESAERNKGVWAKLYAENNGNEELTKASYLRQRAHEIASARALEIKRGDEDALKRQMAKSFSDEKCLDGGLFDEVDINGYKCQKLFNGHAVVSTPIRTMIYKSFDALEEAMLHHKRSGYFSEDGMIKQIRKI